MNSLQLPASNCMSSLSVCVNSKALSTEYLLFMTQLHIDVELSCMLPYDSVPVAVLSLSLSVGQWNVGQWRILQWLPAAYWCNGNFYEPPYRFRPRAAWQQVLSVY